MEHLILPIKTRLSEPLPGLKSHKKMASQGRGDGRAMIPRSDARISAVLILLDDRSGELTLPLIKRPEYPGVHSGQMAFPGGKWERDDTDLTHTAIREAQEEINADVRREDVLGHLTNLYIPPSNSLVTPVVSFAGLEQFFEPDQHEVEQIVHASISGLRNPNTRSVTTIEIASGYKIKAPYFDVGGHVVWGATAMILSELLDVLEELGL